MWQAQEVAMMLLNDSYINRVHDGDSDDGIPNFSRHAR
jgi:hypothetical protein